MAAAALTPVEDDAYNRFMETIRLLNNNPNLQLLDYTPALDNDFKILSDSLKAAHSRKDDEAMKKISKQLETCTWQRENLRKPSPMTRHDSIGHFSTETELGAESEAPANPAILAAAFSSHPSNTNYDSDDDEVPLGPSS